MAFVDEVIIRVQAGAGGNGCVSFRREKFIPYGGPNGGSGGNGGTLYLESTRDKASLLDFKFHPFYRAERGAHGKGKDMDGKTGEDLVLKVPIGTLVYDNSTDELLCDLRKEGLRFPACLGGKGGRGNLSFKTSIHRAPRMAEKGTLGESKELRLELRLLADVGLVGLPNAGKSSLLRAISRCRPKVADYPFTTLEPHLGVIDWRAKSYVVADLPGLIQGASQGAGLGHKFLRHTRRNRVLAHLVDVSQPVGVIRKNIDVIQNELSLFDASLLCKKQVLVFTKADLLSPAKRLAKERKLKEAGLEGIFISSATNQGLDELQEALWIPLDKLASSELSGA